MKKYLFLLASLQMLSGQGALAALMPNQEAAVEKVSAKKSGFAGFQVHNGGAEYKAALAHGRTVGQISESLEAAYDEWYLTQAAGIAHHAPTILAEAASREAMAEAVAGNHEARAHMFANNARVEDLVNEGSMAIIGHDVSRNAMLKAILQGPNPAANLNTGNGLWHVIAAALGGQGVADGRKTDVRNAITAARVYGIDLADIPD